MSLLDPAERSARGLNNLEQLFGGKASEPATLFESSWRDFIFAEVWDRPELDLRSRYFISIAGAASEGGRSDVIDGYIHGALTSEEISLVELREAALHLAVYGGWSCGAAMDTAISRVEKILDLEPAEIKPIRAESWDREQRLEEGKEHFEATMTFGGPPPVTAYFETGILNFVFGEMWCRPDLDQRARRWITMVGVSNSASTIPIRSHTYAAMKSGNTSLEEMHEFVLQYAIHSGWPKASVMQAVVFEMGKRVAEGLPFE